MPPSYTTTAKLLLRKLSGSSSARDIDAGFEALAEDIEAKMGMVKLDEEVGADAAAISFASISQAFTHLRIVGSGRTNDTGAHPQELLLRFNAVAAAEYLASRVTYGPAALASEFDSSPETSMFVGDLASSVALASSTNLSSHVIDIHRYSEARRHWVHARSAYYHATDQEITAKEIHGHFLNSGDDPITQIELLADAADTWDTLSKFSLYALL